MKKGLLIVTMLAVGAFQSAKAQSVYFTGLGRAIVVNDTYEDVSTGTAEKSTASNGYTLFDLGVNIQPDETLKGSVILRLRNEFGGFFGDGSSFEFRQMRLEGLIGKKVKYQIGDLDVALTPYTIHNFEEMYHDYESDLFGIQRNVIAYENFYTDENTWRMQGVDLSTTLLFNKGIDKLGIRAFGNRIIASNRLDTPDRWLAGGKLNVVQSDNFSIGFNYVQLADIQGTLVNAGAFNYNARTYTTDFKYDFFPKDSSKIGVMISGEVGASNFDVKKTAGGDTVSINDYFIDAGVTFKYNPLNLTLDVRYKNVGAYYTSPAAQSRRINTDPSGANNFIDVFNTYNSGADRPQTLFDRYSQESNLYNRAISQSLLPFLPQYNNINPYGDATPNRRGFVVKASIAGKDDKFKLDVKTDMLSEIESEGGPSSSAENLRNYFGIQAGGRVNISKFIDFDKDIVLGAGMRREQTLRDFNSVNFASMLIDVALDVEVFDNFVAMAGYKSVSADGNEFITYRNEFNQVSNINSGAEYTAYDVQESVIALGAKYNFGSKAFFTAQLHLVDYRNANDSNLDYDLTRVYFNYTVKF